MPCCAGGRGVHQGLAKIGVNPIEINSNRVYHATTNGFFYGNIQYRKTEVVSKQKILMILKCVLTFFFLGLSVMEA